MKKKWTIIIIIILIISIITLFMSTKLGNDLKKENTIKNEVKEITKVFSTENIDDDDVNEILNRRLIKKGEYAKVEDSIKCYYQDLYSSIKNLSFLISSSNYSSYLTEGNLKDDAPSFDKSKTNLANYKAQLDEIYNSYYENYSNEDKILSYIKDKKAGNYYVQCYLDVIEANKNEDLATEFEKKYNDNVNKVDIYNQIFDLLIKNKKHWAIVNGSITFDDPKLLDKYLELYNQLDIKEDKKGQAS